MAPIIFGALTIHGAGFSDPDGRQSRRSDGTEVQNASRLRGAVLFLIAVDSRHDTNTSL